MDGYFLKSNEAEIMCDKKIQFYHYLKHIILKLFKLLLRFIFKISKSA